jgi:hypothetical protein
MSTAISSPLLTVKEACAYLKTSRTSLDKLRVSGVLKPVYIQPRCPRYEVEELNRYIASKRF